MDEDRKQVRYHFDRHTPEYRHQFEPITQEMQAKCPIAWTDTYGGHWVAAGAREVFELARSADVVSSDADPKGERRGYQGTTIPRPPDYPGRGGFMEMDPPEQRYWRQALNPYLSPAAVTRWLPVIDEVTRACIDERIETGHIDFIDDLVNVVPAVLTMAMMGIPVKKWSIYSDPIHAVMSTPPGSPEMARVIEMQVTMFFDLLAQFAEIRDDARPGMIDAILRTKINGVTPPEDELAGVATVVIGGGLDTTTALAAHTLEWLSQNPAERERLSRDRETLLTTATEEFLRYFTPVPGDGRTISQDCERVGVQFKEGERLWLSFAMANRDPSVFADPNRIDLARKGNRHYSFGLGIHRCIGSNVARTVFKRMLVAVLDRMPDYVCDPEGTVHYDTIGIIQGMRKLPATFTPGPRLGAGLEQTLDWVQNIVDDQRLAEPIASGKPAP